MTDCEKCGQPIDEFWTKQNIFSHPACDNVLDMRNESLRKKLIEVIKWADEHSARSQQVEIGPSEMGDPCDQKVARILAGMPRVNFRPDPWAAIVGTSIHAWLEKAINFYQDNVQDPVTNLWTEMEVRLDDLIPGHTDVYDPRTGDVIDYKTTGPDGIATMKAHGPLERYKVQGHLYGYAHKQAGREVRDVVLVFLPRAGRLKDMFIWREPYNEQVAKDALARVYALVEKAISLDIANQPDSWAQFKMQPSQACWYCPFFVARPAEQLPDAKGCPGNSKPEAEYKQAAEDRFAKGLI